LNLKPDGWDHFREQALARSKVDQLAMSPMARLHLLATGLTGETGEMLAAWVPGGRPKLIDEAGDCAWHLAMVEGLGPSPIVWPDKLDPLVSPASFLFSLADIADSVKRPLWGIDFPKERYAKGLDAYALNLISYVDRFKVAFSTVLSESIAKNHRRFGPGGFDPKAAMAKADES
jgi:hypothetical protein